MSRKFYSFDLIGLDQQSRNHHDAVTKHHRTNVGHFSTSLEDLKHLSDTHNKNLIKDNK